MVRFVVHHRNDDFAARVTCRKVPDRSSNLFERVAALDDGCDGAGCLPR
jgi:hypothetical protein